MTDNKMTDNEIIQALKCCLAPFGARCRDCSLLKMNLCEDILLQNALDLINRLQAEVERSNFELTKSKWAKFLGDYEQIKAEAYKELLDELIDVAVCKDNGDGTERLFVSTGQIREKIIELVGE